MPAPDQPADQPASGPPEPPEGVSQTLWDRMTEWGRRAVIHGAHGAAYSKPPQEAARLIEAMGEANLRRALDAPITQEQRDGLAEILRREAG